MTDIRQMLKDMRAVQKELGKAALDARLDPAKRMRVIELRKASNAAVLKVSAQMQVEPLFQANPQLGTEFRQRFSDLRSKVAVFQAKWPAILLDTKDPDFETSAANLRACNRAFDEWVAANM
jgi:hypothetical protein